MNYRYIRASAYGAETVEYDIHKKNGHYETTCVINVSLLLCGIRTFPRGDGGDDTLSDRTRLEILRFLKAERQKIVNVEGVKTLDMWNASGLSLEYFLQPGDTVDEELVQHMADSVPPRYYYAGFMQAGEPYSHEPDDNDQWRATWTTFARAEPEGQWTYLGHCFAGDKENRAQIKDPVDRAINELLGKGDASDAAN